MTQISVLIIKNNHLLVFVEESLITWVLHYYTPNRVHSYETGGSFSPFLHILNKCHFPSCDPLRISSPWNPSPLSLSFFGSFLPCCHKWQTAEIWKAWPWLLRVKLCFSGERLRFLCQRNLQKNLEIGDKETLESRVFFNCFFLSFESAYLIHLSDLFILPIW